MIGAGLGGLATALRLQGLGCEVTVVEQRPLPGGRAYRLRDAGFTWDMGPSLLTMPWVLEETFAAGGLDLHSEVTLRRLDPLYRIRWAGEAAHLDFSADPERLRDEVAKFSAADAARVEPFLAALAPIYEQGILGAGRRPFLAAGDFARLVPSMLRLDALRPLHSFVARHFSHPRVREAFSFHSLFIGGDPYRVPAIYAALVYLQVRDGGWYTDGGVYSLVEAMARPLDVRCGEPVERIEHSAGRVTGVRLAGGERIAADVVVSNADVLRTHELVGRPPPRRRLRETMSCFLLYLGTDRPIPQLLHHTLLVGDGYREFIRGVTRGRELPRTFSTYVHAPTRTEPAMGAAGGDSLAVLLPVPNLRAGIDWEREADGLRDALLDDFEASFGLTRAARRDRGRAPHDAAGLRARARRRVGQRVRRRADAPPVSVLPRSQPRPPARRALLRGRRDASRRGRPRRAAGRRGHRRARGPRSRARAPRAGGDGRVSVAAPPPLLVAEARDTTQRVARTFGLACRLLPRAVRTDVYLLYLVFRTLDDLVDEGEPDAAERVAAVDDWAHGRAGERTREVETLETLSERHPLPRSALADFCEGMRWDLAGRVFGTEAELDAYCYRVAGTVGIVMASVLGTTDDRRARPAAAALGMAMQRTNILRDLDEDGAAGRSYLAREVTDRYGAPRPGAREALLRDQIAKADARYEAGIAGIELLRCGRSAVRAAAWMYREILRQIEREGYGARPGRAAVPRRRKLWVAATRGFSI